MKSNGTKKWITDNLWNLILTAIGIAMAFAILNYRVNAMEQKLATYPSYDYFELKFQTIDEKMDILTTTIGGSSFLPDESIGIDLKRVQLLTQQDKSSAEIIVNSFEFREILFTSLRIFISIDSSPKKSIFSRSGDNVR